MALIRNFAMTPQEISCIRPLPPGAAWMSCHFNGTGITDLPENLPQGSLLILDDSIPPDHPEPERILHQLTESIGKLHCEALLLDFQRPGNQEFPELIRLLQKGLSCPVGVSEPYGRDSDGPVFLPLLPPHRSLEDWIQPWEGHEIWLEVGPAPESASVTGKGTSFSSPHTPLPPCPHRHKKLRCHYGIELKEEEILFTLLRTSEDLKALTQDAEALGVTRTVGLYQELF